MFSLLKRTASGLCAALLLLTWPGLVRASDTILPGYDLFRSVEGTQFGGVPFVGVPLGTFDFGSGPVGVGNADTIVHRLDPATASAPDIPIELVALHLQSAVPFDFGLGPGTYFVTLQSERGGQSSVGRMTINGLGAEGDPHGTFDSFFDVFFDLRLGSLTGPIALSGVARLTQTGGLWGHDPVPGEVLIPGINHLLNNVDKSNDFHLRGPVVEQHPGPPPTIHVVSSATPEPSSLALFGLGALVMAARFWRRSRR